MAAAGAGGGVRAAEAGPSWWRQARGRGVRAGTGPGRRRRRPTLLCRGRPEELVHGASFVVSTQVSSRRQAMRVTVTFDLDAWAFPILINDSLAMTTCVVSPSLFRSGLPLPSSTSPRVAQHKSIPSAPKYPLPPRAKTGLTAWISPSLPNCRGEEKTPWPLAEGGGFCCLD